MDLVVQPHGPKAYTSPYASAKDRQLRNAMDEAIDELVVALSKGHKIDIVSRNQTQLIVTKVDATELKARLPHILPSGAHPNARRDGSGTMHHEASTLRIGNDPDKSITDAHRRLHSCSLPRWSIVCQIYAGSQQIVALPGTLRPVQGRQGPAKHTNHEPVQFTHSSC